MGDITEYIGHCPGIHSLLSRCIDYAAILYEDSSLLDNDELFYGEIIDDVINNIINPQWFDDIDNANPAMSAAMLFWTKLQGTDLWDIVWETGTHIVDLIINERDFYRLHFDSEDIINDYRIN